MAQTMPEWVTGGLTAWQAAFRRGLAPLLSTEQLEALRAGVYSDDPRLLQGETTCPPPLECVQDWPCEGACLIGYAFAATAGGFLFDLDGKPNTDNAAVVKEVEEFFARMCFEIDTRLGEAAGCRWLLNWFDQTPRDKMRSGLLAEIDLELDRRKEAMDHVG